MRRPERLRVRASLGSAAFIWAACVGVLVNMAGPPGVAHPFGNEGADRLMTLVCIVPGLALFGYAAARPRRDVIVRRALAATVALAFFAHASHAISNGNCAGDGLCPTMMLNGVFADLAVTLTYATISGVRRQRR